MKAIEKAESLARIASHAGAPLTEFAVSLTHEEAFELLDGMAAGTMGRYEHHALLVKDVKAAHKSGNPWPMLEGFQVLGFPVVALQ